MFDTIQIYKTFFRKPDFRFLMNNGWWASSFYENGEPRQLFFKERDKVSPFLELINTNNLFLYLRAEVSLPHWLFGSNLHLPVNRDTTEGFEMLSNYVTEKSTINFDAKVEKVRRVDYTRDVKLGKAELRQLFKSYRSFSLPRYDRKPINDTTVYFQNKGKEKNKKYELYDKQRERIDNGGTPAEIEMAEGILRIGHSLRGDAVHRFTKSLKILNEARQLLDASVAIPIMDKTVKTLKLQEFLENQEEFWELKAFNNQSSFNPVTLIGHSYLQKTYGANYPEVLGINIGKRTLQRYRKACREIKLVPY